MKTPLPPATLTTEATSSPKLPNGQKAEQKPAPEAWEEFLEDDADCCGGCHHKPR